MANIDVVDLNKKKVGSVDLPDSVFNTEVNVGLVHQVVEAQRAGWRQGTACTKTRKEVQGGGKKPYKQKGTGNARRGSSRSPLMVGGGVSFGPRPRDYSQKVNKKMVNGALKSALSDRFKSDRLMVVDFSMNEPKTKALLESLSKKLGVEKALLVDSGNTNLELSGRNLPGTKVLRTEGLNVYDVIKYDWLLLSKSAVEAVSERLA